MAQATSPPWKRLHLPTQHFLAVKVIKLSLSEEMRKLITQEVTALTQYAWKDYIWGNVNIILDFLDKGSLKVTIPEIIGHIAYQVLK